MEEAFKDYLIKEPHFADETNSEEFGSYAGLNSIFPEFVSNQNLRMWPYLEKEYLQIRLAKMGSPWIRVGPKSNDWCFYKRKERNIQVYTVGMKDTGW